MTRVVVTGMGIVSSIGNNVQEVLSSFHAGKSGITRAAKYAELGFRSRCRVRRRLSPKLLSIDAPCVSMVAERPGSCCAGSGHPRQRAGA